MRKKISEMSLRVKKLTENAYIPTKGSKLSAGYDLNAAYDGLVPARGKTLIKTGKFLIFCCNGFYRFGHWLS